MADRGTNFAEVEALADILEERDLTEIEYERAGVRIRVARVAPVPGVQALTPAAPAIVAGEDTGPRSEEPDPGNAGARNIISPMVGTFYVASSPESSPYVEVGDRVRKGQVVCIIEAMKLLNEIESDCDGVILERLAENAHGVEFEQPLFRVGVG